jgi:hypothetical protein
MLYSFYHFDKLHILNKTEEAIQEVKRSCISVREDAYFEKGKPYTTFDLIQQLEEALKEARKKIFTLKIILRWKYGKAGHESLSYEQMEESCRQILTDETQLRYSKQAEKHKLKSRKMSKDQHLLRFLSQAEHYLNEIRFYWEDDQLDHYQIPHPEIGMLTAREWMYYTIIFCWIQLHRIRKNKEETRIGSN